MLIGRWALNAEEVVPSTHAHSRTSLPSCSEIDGKKQRVIPRDFRVHPFRAKALSINWLRYREGAYPGVRIEIPLKSINGERCPALKEGGWLIELTSKVR